MPEAGSAKARPGRLEDDVTSVRDAAEVLEEEAHQPFQEVPDDWNTRVDEFWREVEPRS